MPLLQSCLSPSGDDAGGGVVATRGLVRPGVLVPRVPADAALAVHVLVLVLLREREKLRLSTRNKNYADHLKHGNTKSSKVSLTGNEQYSANSSTGSNSSYMARNSTYNRNISSSSNNGLFRYSLTHRESPAESLVVVVVGQRVISIAPHGGAAGRLDQTAVAHGRNEGMGSL